MQSRTALLLFALCGFVLATANLGAFLLKASSAPNGYAAAPPNFRSCLPCHDSYALGSGGGSMSIGGLGGSYAPGTTQPMTVTLSRSGSTRWGFELVALDDQGTSVGVLAPANSTTQTSVSGGITYLKQTSAGTFSGTGTSVTWTFDYTAPPAGTGTVRFYASGAACNNNGSDSGDYVYNTAYSAGEGPADATVVIQPKVVNARRGTTWDLPVFLTDGSGAANPIYLVSRVNLGSGRFYPSSGWLSGPTLVNLPAGGTAEQHLLHSIAPTTPLITASYEVLIGRPPGQLVDLDRFTFTVTP